MPTISERGQFMPESPIRRLVPLAEAAIKRGIKVHHLNIGQPDISTPENALAALKTLDMNVIEYGHSAGNESYRKALAAYYQKLGIDVDYSNILITTGGSEAISFTLVCTCNPGDEIIVPEPFYTNYYGFTFASGVKIIPITSTFENGFALPPISEFEKAITPKTRAIMLCNPNNPTGYLYSQQELEQLRDIVKKHDIYLICDEVYREFTYDGNKHYSVLQLSGVDEQVILIDSVSKRYSMCGVRIGAMVSRNKKFLASALKFGQARLCPPGIGQILAEAAIQTPDSYFDKVYNEYVERRNFIINALNKIEGVKVFMPKGAFYSIVKLPVKNADNFCKWLLSDFSYENQTVMLAPASGFYATEGMGNDEVRIAYVLNVDDLQHAVTCLEMALKVYKDE